MCWECNTVAVVGTAALSCEDDEIASVIVLLAGDWADRSRRVRPHTRSVGRFTVKTWVLGSLGTIAVGTVMWLLTELLFPNLFGSLRPKPPITPPAPKVVRVDCSANPPTVRPGGSTEVLVRVTRAGEPVEGASVALSVGGGRFGDGGREVTGSTYSGGVSRAIWTAPSPSAGAYVFPAVVSLNGVRTAEGELEGTYRTECNILVQ